MYFFKWASPVITDGYELQDNIKGKRYYFKKKKNLTLHSSLLSAPLLPLFTHPTILHLKCSVCRCLSALSVPLLVAFVRHPARSLLPLHLMHYWWLQLAGRKREEVKERGEVGRREALNPAEMWEEVEQEFAGFLLQMRQSLFIMSFFRAPHLYIDIDMSNWNTCHCFNSLLRC